MKRKLLEAELNLFKGEYCSKKENLESSFHKVFLNMGNLELSLPEKRQLIFY